MYWTEFRRRFATEAADRSTCKGMAAGRPSGSSAADSMPRAGNRNLWGFQGRSAVGTYPVVNGGLPLPTRAAASIRDRIVRQLVRRIVGSGIEAIALKVYVCYI